MTERVENIELLCNQNNVLLINTCDELYRISSATIDFVSR